MIFLIIPRLVMLVIISLDVGVGVRIIGSEEVLDGATVGVRIRVFQYEQNSPIWEVPCF